MKNFFLGALFGAIWTGVLIHLVFVATNPRSKLHHLQGKPSDSTQCQELRMGGTPPYGRPWRFTMDTQGMCWWDSVDGTSAN